MQSLGTSTFASATIALGAHACKSLLAAQNAYLQPCPMFSGLIHYPWSSTRCATTSMTTKKTGSEHSNNVWSALRIYIFAASPSRFCRLLYVAPLAQTGEVRGHREPPRMTVILTYGRTNSAACERDESPKVTRCEKSPQHGTRREGKDRKEHTHCTWSNRSYLAGGHDR